MVTGDPECDFGLGRSVGSVFREQQLTFFCGQALACRQVGNPAALARAKRNIERFFPVVGVLEQFQASLKVMEEVLPRFFQVRSRPTLLHVQSLKKISRTPFLMYYMYIQDFERAGRVG